MGVIVKPYKGGWGIFVNHRGHRALQTVNSKETANLVKAKLEVELALGNLSCLERKNRGRGKELTFREYVAEQAQLDMAGNKSSTKKTYEENRVRYVYSRFGDKKLSSITREEIKNIWLKELVKKGLARQTIQLAIASLRIPLMQAVDDKLIESNPASRLGWKKGKGEGHKGKSMSEEQVEQFLEAALNDKYYPLFGIGFLCGLREGETIALRWRHIYLGKRESDLRYIHVEKRWYKGEFAPPKGGDERDVVMPAGLRQVLYEYREKQLLKAYQMGRTSIDDDLLFPGRDGVRPIGVWSVDQKHFKRILKQAGLGHYRMHDMRHTFGSMQIQNGAPLPWVSAQMGHASIQVTVDIYCRLIPEKNLGWADRLSHLVPDATQTQPEEAQNTLSRSKESVVLRGQHKHRVSLAVTDSKGNQ